MNMSSALYVAMFISAAWFPISIHAGPGPNRYHGIECMSANLAQGELLVWNKDGITNNSSRDLFVICPMTYDFAEVEGFATPAADTTVSVFFPPELAAGTQMPCFIRTLIAEPSQPQVNDNQVVVTSLAFNVGNKNVTANGENDNTLSPVYSLGVATVFPSVPNAHLLCRIPAGGTLRAYDMFLQDAG